ncbi:MAG TPA: hypothetical protein VGK27_09155 [Candidatus Deferrimicrobiaceae bacterium]
MISEIRYADPDGVLIPRLPAGVGAAIGSDYCIHLLPGRIALTQAIEETSARDIPLLLLTPYLRDAELKRVTALLRSIPAGADVTLSVNDWGALYAWRTLFPELPLTLGRLLSGQKSCPRIGVSDRLTDEERAWHGEGLHSSPVASRFLTGKMGIRGFHVDALPWGIPRAMPMADGEGETPLLFVHEGWPIVTVSDRCPWLGGASSASVSACPRHCREGRVRLREPSMGDDLIARGKARFAERKDEAPQADSGVRTIRVRYDGCP